MESIERVAARKLIDHTMIETLTDSLESAGIDLANLEADWRKRIDSRILETEEVDRLGARMQRILEGYRGNDRQQFGVWIEKSYDLLVADRAFVLLDRGLQGFQLFVSVASHPDRAGRDVIDLLRRLEHVEPPDFDLL